MLLLGKAVKEVVMAEDTVIFLLQHRDYVINLKNLYDTITKIYSF